MNKLLKIYKIQRDQCQFNIKNKLKEIGLLVLIQYS